MKKLIILVITFIALIGEAYAQNEYAGKVWGKLVEKKTKSKNEKMNKYKYYLEVKKDNEVQVFPLVALKEQEIEKLKKSVNQTIRVEGKLVGRKIYVDRQPIVYYEMQADQVLAMSMKDLMPNSNPNVEVRRTQNGASVHGGIEIDDDVANATIFAAGAALLYSIIKDK